VAPHWVGFSPGGAQGLGGEDRLAGRGAAFAADGGYLMEISMKFNLVGGLEHLLFFHVLEIIIPTDELIFFRGVGQPPTSNGT